VKGRKRVHRGHSPTAGERANVYFRQGTADLTVLGTAPLRHHIIDYTLQTRVTPTIAWAGDFLSRMGYRNPQPRHLERLDFLDVPRMDV